MRMIQVPPEAFALELLLVFDLPLIAVIIIDPDQIQKVGRASQFGLYLSAQHVPCLELAFAICRRMVLKIRPVVMRYHVYQRITVQDARSRVDFPDRLATLEGCAYQL